MAGNTNQSFVLVSEQDLSELLDGSDAENTKKQIRYAVNRLDAYAACAGTSLAAVEAMDEADLDKFLSRFFAGLRKADGTLYTKKTMHGIRYGLHRHFKAQRDIDITKSDKFSASNGVYKAMMVKLKKEGKGSIRHKNSISKEDMARIFSSEALNITTPLGLQNKVFMDVMIYYANRGRENVRDMKADDFVLQTDEQNLRYIVHRDTLTKTRRENDDEGYSGYMYEIPGSSRCPVSSFLAYKDVLNPAIDCLWQRPKPTAPSEGPWFCNAPLGVNTLGTKMKAIADAAGCAKKYTNHSLRATTVTVLDHAGFASRDIMAVTGHKSESSLKHYARTSDEKKKEMSASIALQMQENAPPMSGPTARPSPTCPRPTAASEAKLDDPIQEEGLDAVAVDNILTHSQEQLILQESNFSIQNATTSSVQHFHFHGPVTFYNK